MEKTIYDQVLQLFTGIDHFRDWTKTPFYIENTAIATDCQSMVFFDKSLCSNIIEFSGTNPTSVIGVTKVTEHLNISISVNELKEVFMNLPLIDEISLKTGLEECKACYGGGVVDFSFEHGRKTYELEGDCPICEGQGDIETEIKTPTGNKIPDFSKCITLGKAMFTCEILKKLVDASTLLGVSELKLVSQESNTSAAVLKANDIRFLIMPYRADKAESVYTLNK